MTIHNLPNHSFENFKCIIILYIICLLGQSTFAQNWAEWNYLNSNLPNSTFTGVDSDSSGNVWVSSYNGVAKFNNGTWQIFTSTNSPLPSDVCYSIATEGNIIWIGTVNGLVKYDGVSSWTIYTIFNSGLPYDYIVSVYVDRSHVKWISTIDPFGGLNAGGVTKYDDASWTTYNEMNSGLVSNFAFNTYVDVMNRKWIGTNNSGLNVFNDTIWEIYNVLNSGICNNSISKVEQDSNNLFWISTNNGLCTFDDVHGTWFTYDSTSGLPSNSVGDIEIDNNNTKWITLIGSGIASLNGTFWTFFDSTNTGKDINYTQDIKTIGSNVWLATGSGVFFYGDTSILKIDNIPPLDFSLYPNPCNDKVVVNIKLLDEIIGFSIYDLRGRVICEHKSNSNIISVDNLSPGMYFLTIYTSKNKYTKPFLKN